MLLHRLAQNPVLAPVVFVGPLKVSCAVTCWPGVCVADLGRNVTLNDIAFEFCHNFRDGVRACAGGYGEIACDDLNGINHHEHSRVTCCWNIKTISGK